MFVINCMCYEQVSGDKIHKLVDIAERVSAKYNVKIAVAPPTHLLGSLSKSKVMILAQNIDNAEQDFSTGYTLASSLKDSNVKGSILNHYNHPIPYDDLKKIIENLRQLKMISIVYATDLKEVKLYSKLNPDYIALEPPRMAFYMRSLAIKEPKMVTDSLDVLKGTKTKLLCGAAMVVNWYVERTMELGAHGIINAISIIKSKDWESTIDEFAKEMQDYRNRS